MDAAQVYGTQTLALPRAQRAALIVAPAVLAGAYPWLLTGDLLLARASGGASLAIGVASVLGIATACAILALSVVICRAADELWARLVCVLAATTPTLYVGAMNYAYLFGVAPMLKQIWIGAWLMVAVAGLLLSRQSRRARPLLRKQTLVTAHGISAAAILVVFLAPHIANHLAGLWSGAGHVAIMHAVRGLYRNPAVEPILFALVAFQITSGLVLVAPRLQARVSWRATLQATSGIYVGVFFVGHLAAVLGARFAGTDTDWNWLTGNDAGLLANLNRIYLVPHYWIGVIALATHLACGLRDVLVRHGFPILGAERAVTAAIGIGACASTLILLGLLGLHLA